MRRERLVEAATQVFAERGYEGARVEQIADAADVSPGLLYRHFEGKQELYTEILQLANRQLMAHLAEAAAPKLPTVERVRAGLDAFFTFVENHRQLWQMLMKDVLEPDIADIREEVTRRSVQAVAALAAQDYEGGGDMPHEVELEGVAVQVVGAAVSLASWWNDHPELPRRMMVNLAMEVLWVGLERARSGERLG
ncbi:MAG TPA: TetR/AcrR family transcriptional regulator [Solirubrobacterales bacterium]|nr:TetR/AcrR family transcriptional regulator [Solirubrobacterales bacterium]